MVFYFLNTHAKNQVNRASNQVFYEKISTVWKYIKKERRVFQISHSKNKARKYSMNT